MYGLPGQPCQCCQNWSKGRLAGRGPRSLGSQGGGYLGECFDVDGGDDDADVDEEAREG